MKKKLALLVAVCVQITNIAAQSTYDVYTYNEPAGYTKAVGNGYISYTKTNNQKGSYCVISLYAAVKNTQPLQAAFNEEWKTLVVNVLAVKNNAAINKVKAINGWEGLSGSTDFDFNGGKGAALLFCYAKDEKVASILIISNSNEYESGISALLEKIKLPATESPAKKTPENPVPINVSNTVSTNSIEGIWLYYGLDFNTQMSWQEMVFFKDGTSLDIIPRSGLYNYSVNQEQNQFAHIGKYSFKNGKGYNQLTPSYKEVLSMIKPGQLKIDSRLYTKSVVIDGQGIAGSFTSYANPSDPTLQTLPYGQKPVIHFYKDGKFTDEGLFATFLQTYGAKNDEAGSGTYELKDYSILLKYNDGRTRQEAFYTVFADNLESATRIFLGKGQLNKMK
jgi:hypothetical protein